MKKLLLAGIATIGIAGAANAVPIPAGSTLNIVGNATFSSIAVLFTNPAGLVTGTGAFTSLGTCTGCVTMSTPSSLVTAASNEVMLSLSVALLLLGLVSLAADTVTVLTSWAVADELTVALTV